VVNLRTHQISTQVGMIIGDEQTTSMISKYRMVGLFIIKTMVGTIRMGKAVKC
jgi:hypothetical protein